MMLPSKYSWLSKEKAPAILVEALKHYGTLEHPGPGSNPNIMQWATEVGVSGWYRDDDIPWCGLFMAVIAKRAGYPPPPDSLAAKNWLRFGKTISKEGAMLADILVFSRPGGNHVGLYVGENQNNFLVLGGNQSNAVGFAFVAKDRCIGVRRCIWKIGQPMEVRKIILNFDGTPSTNEA